MTWSDFPLLRSWPLLVFLAACSPEPAPDDNTGDDDDSTDASFAGPYEINAIPLTSLELQNMLGGASITAEPGRTNVDIRVLAQGADGAEPGELDPTVQVEVEVRGSRLSATVSGSLAEGSPGLDLVVVTPPELDYTLRLPSGSAEVSGMIATGDIQVDEGSLSGQGLEGDLSVLMGAGAIDLEVILEPWGSVDVAMGTGDIQLQVPADTSAQLDAVATDGQVFLQGLDLAGIHVEGEAHGVLGTGEGSLVLNATSGDIQIEGTSR